MVWKVVDKKTGEVLFKTNCGIKLTKWVHANKIDLKKVNMYKEKK